MSPAVEAGARRRGWLWALTAVAIWASWFAVTAHGVRGTLTTLDVALLRVVAPALVLLGPLWTARRRLAALRAADVAGLALYGLPFIGLVAAGLAQAPVSHAVALVPGVMPVLAGLWATLASGVRHPPLRLVGFAAMSAGAVLIVAATGGGGAVGHLCLLAASGCLAVFTVTARRLALPPLVATALVAFVSSLVVIPLHLAWPVSRLAEAAASELALQLVVQGLLAGLVAIYAYARAIRLLGTAAASAAVALVPPTATLLGWLALGERPGPGETVAVLLVALGVVAASGLGLKPPKRAETA